MCSDRFTKDDLFKILETNDMLIENCDNKASIILAAIGIVTSVLFSTDVLESLSPIILNSFFNKGIMLIPSIIMWFSILFMLLGVVFFVLAISPRLEFRINKNKKKTRFDSVMFYGTVAELSFEDYKDKVTNKANDGILDDLCFQILSTAKICKKKFVHLKRGIWFFFPGAFLFILTVLFFAAI